MATFEDKTLIRDKTNLEYINEDNLHLTSQLWDDGLGLNPLIKMIS